MSVYSLHLQVKHVHFATWTPRKRERQRVIVRRPDGSAADVPMSFTISHRCEFEDGVQGTLQVRQVAWKQRHKSDA